MVEEVVREILWTNSARISFQRIVEYLLKEWTGKEVEQLILRTEQMISTLKRYPEMCRPSLKRKNVRIGILDRRTQLIYRYKPRNKRIEILLFWSMKQNPAKFKF